MNYHQFCYLRRFSSFGFGLTGTWLKFIRNYSSMNDEKINKLIEFTGGSASEIEKFIKGNKALDGMNESELEYRLKRLKALSIVDNDPLKTLRLLKLHPATLKHRYYALEEAGILPQCLSSDLILRFLSFIKKKIYLIKARGLINKCNDVLDHLSSVAEIDKMLLSGFDEDSCIVDIKIGVLGHFLVQNCGFDPVDPRLDEGIIKRLKYKSLKEVKKSIDVLKTKLGFTTEKIVRNPFLLFSSEAENTMAMIEACPVVAGLDIGKVMTSHPKIISTTAENFIETVEMLKEFEIPNNTLARCLEIFTLKKDTIYERLTEIKDNNMLNVRRHHPRILELVIYRAKARERLQELERMRIPYASLNRLASNDAHFQKFCDFGSERHHGRDIIYFLKSELSRSKEELLQKLDRHPYWTYTSLIVINCNLTVLRKRGFSNDAIYDEVSILMYPTKRIEDEMDKLVEKPEVACCCDESKKIREECILPLTLYYIEKDSNFSGGAIWDKEATYPQPPHFSERLPIHQEVT